MNTPENQPVSQAAKSWTISVAAKEIIFTVLAAGEVIGTNRCATIPPEKWDEVTRSVQTRLTQETAVLQAKYEGVLTALSDAEEARQALQAQLDAQKEECRLLELIAAAQSAKLSEAEKDTRGKENDVAIQIGELEKFKKRIEFLANTKKSFGLLSRSTDAAQSESATIQ